MVGYDPKKITLSPAESAFAGASAGGFTRMFTQPLDVLKIRFQLQIEPIAKSSVLSKYRGITQATKLIVREEGVTALWKGHITGQVMSTVYGGVEFATFEFVTKLVSPVVPESMSTGSLKPVLHFVSGSVAGSAATIVCQPFDVLRTRFVAQGEPKIYKTYAQACITMYKTEGISSFYKGLVPTLLQIGPYVGFQFGFYSLLKLVWDTVLEPAFKTFYFKDGLQTLVCGSTAGMCAKMAVYPLDLMKKRLQVQGFEAAHRPFGETVRYRGLIHCMLSVMKREGVRGLYKGVTPSMVKAAVTTGMHFSVYETVCRLLSLRYPER